MKEASPKKTTTYSLRPLYVEKLEAHKELQWFKDLRSSTRPSMVKLWMNSHFHFPQEHHGKMIFASFAPHFFVAVKFISWHMRFHEMMLIYVDHAWLQIVDCCRRLRPRANLQRCMHTSHVVVERTRTLTVYYNIEMHQVREGECGVTSADLIPTGSNWSSLAFLLMNLEVGRCWRHIHKWQYVFGTVVLLYLLTAPFVFLLVGS